MYFVVDVEADGPIPGDYSMVSLGAVAVDDALDKTFYAEFPPISDDWSPEALGVSGWTRAGHEAVQTDPKNEMQRFATWLHNTAKGQRAIFVSDNLAFDWQWVNWYFHHFIQHNPFGFSGRRIGDVWAGWKGNMRNGSEWKKFRKTKHTHNPVDDAKGNAEAILYMRDQGIKL